MTRALVELDVVEVMADQESGIVEGARGVVVAVTGDTCTVEFVDSAGYTIGLFEIPRGDLRPVPTNLGMSVAREE